MYPMQLPQRPLTISWGCCTAPDACPIAVWRSCDNRLESERTHLVLACGFLKESQLRPGQIPSHKLEKLTCYFNQRRDQTRSRISIRPFDLDDGFSRCKGEFLHDVGMLSQEAVTSRRSPF